MKFSIKIVSHTIISNPETKAAPSLAVTLLRRGSSHSLFTLDEEEESKATSGEGEILVLVLTNIMFTVHQNPSYLSITMLRTCPLSNLLLFQVDFSMSPAGQTIGLISGRNLFPWM